MSWLEDFKAAFEMGGEQELDWDGVFRVAQALEDALIAEGRLLRKTTTASGQARPDVDLSPLLTRVHRERLGPLHQQLQQERMRGEEAPGERVEALGRCRESVSKASQEIEGFLEQLRSVDDRLVQLHENDDHGLVRRLEEARKRVRDFIYDTEGWGAFRDQVFAALLPQHQAHQRAEVRMLEALVAGDMQAVEAELTTIEGLKAEARRRAPELLQRLRDEEVSSRLENHRYDAFHHRLQWEREFLQTLHVPVVLPAGPGLKTLKKLEKKVNAAQEAVNAAKTVEERRTRNAALDADLEAGHQKVDKLHSSRIARMKLAMRAGIRYARKLIEELEEQKDVRPWLAAAIADLKSRREEMKRLHENKDPMGVFTAIVASYDLVTAADKLGKQARAHLRVLARAQAAVSRIEAMGSWGVVVGRLRIAIETAEALAAPGSERFGAAERQLTAVSSQAEELYRTFKALSAASDPYQAALLRFEERKKQVIDAPVLDRLGGRSGSAESGLDGALTTACAGPLDRLSRGIAAAVHAAGMGQSHQEDHRPDAALQVVAEALALLEDCAGIVGELERLEVLHAALLKALAGGRGKKKLGGLAKQLMELPGGEQLVDGLVRALPSTTDASVLATLCGERFGLKMSVQKRQKGSGKAKDQELQEASDAVRGLYEMLAKVPPEHALQNPSLKKLKRRLDGDADSYSGEGSVVVMVSRLDQGVEKLQLRAELGPKASIELDCRPRAGFKPPLHFSWNALHEIGHAVDDMKAFMLAKGPTDTEYGGWQVHTDLTPIASLVCSVHGYDPHYVLERMKGQRPDPVANPDPKQISVEAWEAAKKRVDRWADVTRSQAEPWGNHAELYLLELNGRIYHEAYTNLWVSYLASARKRGISGYQFRAPGEWFAELYAAFHAGALRESHPSWPWLAGL